MTRTDPMVQDALQQIHDKHGILRAVDVVQEAVPAASVLHPFFEWDDVEAAHEYRLEQARQLIRVQVHFEPRINRDIPVYVSVQSDRVAPSGGYRPIAWVMSDAQYRAELLADALRDLDHFRIRYAALVELSDVFAAAARARSRRTPPAPPPPPPGPSSEPPLLGT